MKNGETLSKESLLPFPTYIISMTTNNNYGDGNVVLAWSVKGDTGFDFLTIGKNARRKISFEGMDLVSYHPAS